MAGDWIKMRLSLVTHPRVMRLAEVLLYDHDYLGWASLSQSAASDSTRRAALRITRYVTVTALLKFWGYANEHIEDDETIRGVSEEDVDEISGVPGFANAMKEVGWIDMGEKGILMKLPNFNKYNVSAGSRTPAAERQKRYRDKQKEGAKSDVTRDVTVTPREEKRREEKKEPKTKAHRFALPPWIPADAWESFEEHRKKSRKPMTDRARELIVAELEKLKPADPAQVLLQSVRKGWQDVFPLKAEGLNGHDWRATNESIMAKARELNVDIGGLSTQQACAKIQQRIAQ